MKKIGFLIMGIISFILIGLAADYFVFKKLVGQNHTDVRNAKIGCLGEDEEAGYIIDRKLSVSPVEVIVKNKKNSKEISRFMIDSVLPVYEPVQVRKCGVYVIRELTGDYRVELWFYDYAGTQKKLLSLFNYSYDFRIDPYEKYIVLLRGYMGLPEYALVIKDFYLDRDEFVLLRQSLFEKYPDFFGDFGLKSWIKNGDSFWARLFTGAQVEAFIRILRDSWVTDVLPAPEGTQGGDALNVERGYVTYNTGPGWIGIHEIAEQIYDEWRKDGKIVELYLYNLFTKEKTLVATSTNPSWWGKPYWLSDTELQYEMPSGEKKIYKINEK